MTNVSSDWWLLVALGNQQTIKGAYPIPGSKTGVSFPEVSRVVNTNTRFSYKPGVDGIRRISLESLAKISAVFAFWD